MNVVVYGPEYLLSFFLIALVSKVTLLEWLSKFARCCVPRESVLRGSSAHKATRTAQNLKVTLLEWLMKLTLLEWHQVFRPYVDIDQGIYKLKLKVALNEKRKKLHGFSFSINMANFLKRFGGQKVECKPLFFEVWQKYIVPYILTHM